MVKKSSAIFRSRLLSTCPQRSEPAREFRRFILAQFPDDEFMDRLLLRSERCQTSAGLFRQRHLATRASDGDAGQCEISLAPSHGIPF
jgi:hypothetical protein